MRSVANSGDESAQQLVVRRHKHAQQFVVIPNALAQGSQLSLRARGLLLYLLSLPEDTPISAWRVSQQTKEGRDAVGAAMRELRAAGYAAVYTERLPGGTFRSRVEVSDLPFGSGAPAAPAIKQVSNIEQAHLFPQVTPGTENQESGNQESGSQEPKDKEQPQRKTFDQTAFDRFWSIYPRRVGKQAAVKAFAKASHSVSPLLILAGAERYRDDPNRVDQFTAHPSTWLNQGRWDDDPLPPRQGVRQDQPDVPWPT